MRRRVLIADDTASHRMIVAAALRNLAGVEVCVTKSGREAIEEAKKQEARLGSTGLGDAGNEWRGNCHCPETFKASPPCYPFHPLRPGHRPTLAAAVGVDLVLSKARGLEKLVSAVAHLLGGGSVEH
jgi:CheY-like chemotaxis protein